jgi:hypothetical protein
MPALMRACMHVRMNRRARYIMFNEPWSIWCARWDGEEEEPEQHQSLRREGGRAGELMSTG